MSDCNIIYETAKNPAIRGRITSGYGPYTARANDLYEDAVQTWAMSEPSDPKDVETMVEHCRAYIGRQLLPIRVERRNLKHESRSYKRIQRDYPQAFLNSLPEKTQTVYHWYAQVGDIDKAAEEAGITTNHARVRMAALPERYAQWILRPMYDPVVAAKLLESSEFLSLVYSLHYKDGRGIGQIAIILKRHCIAVSNALRVVRQRMPYGGSIPPKTNKIGPVRLRAPRGIIHKTLIS